MEKKYDNMIGMIRKLPINIERTIDELLPDTYAYIGNITENFRYQYQIPIEGEEIRYLANQTFKIINKNALPEIYNFSYQIINQIEKSLEENESIERVLIQSKDYLIDAFTEVFNRYARIGIMDFETEFSYRYVRKIDSPSVRHLNSRLLNTLENLMEENIQSISKQISRQIDHIIDEYMIVQRKADSFKEEEKNSREEAKSVFENALTQIYENYKLEINESEEVKECFNSLQKFYMELISKGVTKDTIDSWDLALMKDLELKFKNAIEKYKNISFQEDSYETILKTKNQTNEEIESKEEIAKHR